MQDGRQHCTARSSRFQPVTIEDGGRDSETDGRFCAFAVAGVAASSPPLARVQEALGWLGSADGPPGSDTLAEHVAWALIAASPHDEPPDQLRSLMSEHAESLEACFENYWSDSTAEIRYMENETAKAYCAYNTGGSFEDWQVEAHFDMPRLVVFYYDEGETWSGQPRPVSRWLFLPRDPRKHEQ